MGKKLLALLIAVISIFSVVSFSACNKDTFTVTFHANGGTLVSGQEVQTVSSASEIAPPVYEKKGYGLTGFDKVISTIDCDTDVYAVWNYKIFKLFFNANGGTISQSEFTVAYDSILQELPKPTKSGFVFAGWYVDDIPLHKGNRWNFDSNKTAIARWETDGFTIEYDLNGGSAEGLKTFYKSTDEDYVLPIPTKKGYTFKGWKVNEDSTLYSTYAITSGSYGNLTFKAFYEAIPCTLTLDADGGTITSANISVIYDAPIPTLEEPVKEGFKFLGWYVDNEPLLSGQKWNYEQDKTAVAMYREINATVYRINYNLDGGTLENAKTTYEKTDFTFNLSEPKKEGYKFVGWLKEGESEPKKTVTIQKGTTGDFSFTAIWEKYFVFRFVLYREVKILGRVAYCTVNGAESFADMYLTKGEIIQLPMPVLKDVDDYYFDKNSSGDFMYWVIDYIENAPVPDNVGKVLYSGEEITADFTQYEKDGVIIVRPRIRARYV